MNPVGARERLAADYAGKIRAAMRSAVNIQQVLEAWARVDHEMTAAEARAWTATHVTLNVKPLESILRLLYGDAWVMGRRVGLASLAAAAGLRKVSRTEARAALTTNWSTWKPGYESAAALVSPEGGLRRLLDGRNATVKGINDTTLDRMGTALAVSLKSGLSADQTAQMLWDVIDDPIRAVTIARTELASAMSMASRNEYQEAGVEMVEWLVADPCDECADNEAASPLPIDQEFPSGDTEPPAHPNCMCSLAPYIVDTSGLFSEEE